jgi:glutaconate CoA-transferase subunit B
MTDTPAFTLSELMIVAAAEAFRGDGELLVTGIGTLPRIAAGLAKLTFEPGIMMTDGEAFLTEDPVPLGTRAEDVPGFSGWMPYNRVFATLWRGQRHAMVTPVQVDQWAQTNISCLGDFTKPKVQMLGVRGFPGNSVCHKNSMLIPSHSKRAFVAGEVDVVSSAGFSDKRWPEGMRRPKINVGPIITDLCVMDFNGPDHAARVVSLHPGVTFDMVQEATGFPLLAADGLGETPAPTTEQLEIIHRLDPHNMRAKAVKGNPPGLRQAA